jgi:FecR protein
MARLSDVVGNVQLLRGDQTQFDQAVVNMPLIEGSRLQTGTDGQAEVQFGDGSIARLAPNSSMSVTQLRRNADGQAVTQVEILSGLGYFELRSDSGENSVLYGSNVISPIDGPATVRLDLDARPAEMGVLDGKVHVAGGTQFAVDVRTDESIRFDATDVSRYYLAEGVTPDSWDTWNSDRNRILADQEQQRTDAGTASANSSDPSWADLDQNGSWYAVPGYGDVWTPYGAGPGWDPYGSGYWGYYSGGGYYWISGYPWGWLPYRCGGWNYFNAFGWGWMPANCGLGWNPGVVIIGRPPGYHPPPRPHPSNVVASGGSFNPRHLVRVDRGAQATALAPPQPRFGGNRPVTYNGAVLTPLPSRGGPSETFLHATSRPAPAAPPMPRGGGAGSMRMPYNPSGGPGAVHVAVPRHDDPGFQDGATTAPMPRTYPGAPVPSQPRNTAPAPTPAPRTSAPVQPYPPPAPRYSPAPQPAPTPRYTPPPSASAPRYSPPPPAPAPHYSPPPMQYSPPPAPAPAPGASHPK